MRDVVALLSDMDTHGLLRGQVGTVVERLSHDDFEIEFSDDQGRTYAQLGVHRDSVLVLHYRPARARPASSANSELPSSEIGWPTSQDSLGQDAGLDAFKWPGDETDEELAATLAAWK